MPSPYVLEAARKALNSRPSGLKKNWFKAPRKAVLAELERRANSPLLCYRTDDLPISAGEYRALKAEGGSK